jgi:SAM-dependent methyltransferase
MTQVFSDRRYGVVFDQVADEYDRHRPAYPDELIDRACELAGIESGDAVLELGCGSGQLTRSLVDRGLRVTAVEPGGQLLALARQNLDGADGVEFVNERFEDAQLSPGRFGAVFCASAFHWIDPAVSWRKAAALLSPGGTLALIQYFGLREDRTAADQATLLGAVAEVVPEVAAGWPAYRDMDGIRAGAQERRQNVSELWSWLGSYDLAWAQAGPLFEEAELAAVPNLLGHTGEELNALLRTMSFHASLSPEQRGQIERRLLAIHERLGRPIRSSTVAVLVTARRRTEV